MINHDAWTLDAERLIAKAYQDEQVSGLLQRTNLLQRLK